MVEVSSARQALEGFSLATGTEATLNALRDPSKRLREPRTPVLMELSSPEPRSFFNLEEVRSPTAGSVALLWVTRTMSQQMMEECIAHAFQGLTEMNVRATVMSIDGISAYDLVSRKAMLQGLNDLTVGSSALPVDVSRHPSS